MVSAKCIAIHLSAPLINVTCNSTVINNLCFSNHGYMINFTKTKYIFKGKTATCSCTAPTRHY